MASRLDLQRKLEELFNSKNVYFKPPETFQMEYPAIRYSYGRITSKYANDKAYITHQNYEIIVIDRKPDNEVIKKLLALPLCSHDRHYTAENLYHDVFNLYF